MVGLPPGSAHLGGGCMGDARGYAAPLLPCLLSPLLRLAPPGYEQAGPWAVQLVPPGAGGTLRSKPACCTKWRRNPRSEKQRGLEDARRNLRFYDSPLPGIRP
jgi:hypothetical protein